MTESEGRALWNQKAAFWDRLHGKRGNRFHNTVVGPAAERLLQVQPGERVLDIACGNGAFARRLAELGAEVLAVDFSEALIEHARQHRTEDKALRYQQVDATNEAALTALGEASFDAIVSTMALMDIADIAPLFRASRSLLKNQASSRLVFVTAHPAFSSNNPNFMVELADIDGEPQQRRSLKIDAYLEVPPSRAVGAPGEPCPHFYYHRPLSELLKPAFDAGFTLDALEEPAFSKDDAEQASPLSWTGLWQIPPVLAARLRPAPKQHQEQEQVESPLST